MEGLVCKNTKLYTELLLKENGFDLSKFTILTKTDEEVVFIAQSRDLGICYYTVDLATLVDFALSIKHVYCCFGVGTINKDTKTSDILAQADEAFNALKQDIKDGKFDDDLYVSYPCFVFTDDTYLIFKESADGTCIVEGNGKLYCKSLTR